MAPSTKSMIKSGMKTPAGILMEKNDKTSIISIRNLQKVPGNVFLHNHHIAGKFGSLAVYLYKVYLLPQPWQPCSRRLLPPWGRAHRPAFPWFRQQHGLECPSWWSDSFCLRCSEQVPHVWHQHGNAFEENLWWCQRAGPVYHCHDTCPGHSLGRNGIWTHHGVSQRWTASLVPSLWRACTIAHLYFVSR